MSVQFSAIVQTLGRSTRVYAIDGVFHHLIGNIYQGMGKSSKVVGGKMACGLTVQHPSPSQWQTARMLVSNAIIDGHKPCHQCFEAAL